jgi:hypothetical protein
MTKKRKKPSKPQPMHRSHHIAHVETMEDDAMDETEAREEIPPDPPIDPPPLLSPYEDGPNLQHAITLDGRVAKLHRRIDADGNEGWETTYPEYEIVIQAAKEADAADHEGEELPPGEGEGGEELAPPASRTTPSFHCDYDVEGEMLLYQDLPVRPVAG